MNDDLEEELERWGSSKAPRVDGAFANRLETSLRSEMLEGSLPAGPRGLALLMRPSILVIGIAVLLFGFALASRGVDEPSGLADGGASTSTAPVDGSAPSTGVPIPSEPVDEPPVPTSQEPDASAGEPSVPGPTVVQTTVPDDGSSGTTDATTVPDTTIPDTTVPDTTIPVTTDAPTEPTITATLVIQSDAQVQVRWRVTGDISDVAGWTVIRTVGDRRGSAAAVRDPAIRRLVVDIVNRDATFRVEGRAADGSVVVASDDVALNLDG